MQVNRSFSFSLFSSCDNIDNSIFTLAPLYWKSWCNAHSNLKAILYYSLRVKRGHRMRKILFPIVLHYYSSHNEYSIFDRQIISTPLPLMYDTSLFAPNYVNVILRIIHKYKSLQNIMCLYYCCRGMTHVPSYNHIIIRWWPDYWLQIKWLGLFLF